MSSSGERTNVLLGTRLCETTLGTALCPDNTDWRQYPLQVKLAQMKGRLREIQSGVRREQAGHGIYLAGDSIDGCREIPDIVCGTSESVYGVCCLYSSLFTVHCLQGRYTDPWYRYVEVIRP
jgi:hypothetical protein